MKDRVLTKADILAWIAAFLVASALLVATRFTSADPDSSRYAGLSARLTQEPVARWIAPEWWGLWPRLNPTGYYRDHPIGGFVMPAALARLGVPADQAAYVVGMAASVGTIWLLAWIAGSLGRVEDGRAALILLQLMPVAFIFRVRANQEYAMLVCMLVACLAIDLSRRHWSASMLLTLALSLAVVIKGAFVALTLLGVGLWLVLNPRRVAGSFWRAAVALAIAIGGAGGVAWAYDVWHTSVTGSSFWREYSSLQLGIVEVATPASDPSALAERVLFYLSRLIWHPLPWSVALAAVLWRARGHMAESWRALPETLRYGLLFTAGYALLSVALLSPSNRVAERYVFSATYLVATAGAVAAYRASPSLRRWITGLDHRVPGAPALLWLLLVSLRLVAGSVMPRI